MDIFKKFVAHVFMCPQLQSSLQQLNPYFEISSLQTYFANNVVNLLYILTCGLSDSILLYIHK